MLSSSCIVPTSISTRSQVRRQPVQSDSKTRVNVRNGKNKIISSLFIELTNHEGKSFQLQYELNDLNNLRTLINRENRKGPEFYGAKDSILPIANAETVMYEYAKAKEEKDIG